MPIVDPLKFFDHLKWLDRKPLVVEPYRRRIFSEALSTVDGEGSIPKYNLVLAGRGKKNYKTLDLVLVALYKLMVQPSLKGNDCFILANDEDQAADDLSLAKKIIEVNPSLKCRVKMIKGAITRRDGGGFLRILPARDVAGAHGKTFLFCGFDEIHSYRTWDLFEALALDPHRPEAMTWITSYASIYNYPGIPLHDLTLRGKTGQDPGMFFSWYSGDYCTDPEFASKETPEERANPSILPQDYLKQQKIRLPIHKYRRLHLNLPGSPEGAWLPPDKFTACLARNGSGSGMPNPNHEYQAFVDMSGGSNDDATLSISHKDGEYIFVDLVMDQGARPPFNPREAVKRFSRVLKLYRIHTVWGDKYAGETFIQDFQKEGIEYRVSTLNRSQIYEALEPLVNSQSVVLPDNDKMIQQFLGLVWSGKKIDHSPGEHDDWANSAAGAASLWSVPRHEPRIRTLL